MLTVLVEYCLAMGFGMGSCFGWMGVSISDYSFPAAIYFEEESAMKVQQIKGDIIKVQRTRVLGPRPGAPPVPRPPSQPVEYRPFPPKVPPATERRWPNVERPRISRPNR